MFSLAGKLLVSTIAGVAPIATIVVVTSSVLSAPPSQEHKLTREDSSSSIQNSELTVTKKQQEAKEQEHDDCLDQNIKVVIRNSRGHQETVPVTELSKYKDYELVSADYKTGTCSREK